MNTNNINSKSRREERRKEKGERRKEIFVGFVVLFSITVLLVGCRVRFSLTGGSVHPSAKTVYVATFPNNASLVNPNLSQDFTAALKERIQTQTPLTIIDLKNADYVFEGAISIFSVTPIALQGSSQGNDMAAMNRLTISVRVTFKSLFEENLNFDQTFSRYADYSSVLNFATIESGLVQEIVSALTEDIFNRAFVNW
ncbi:MAG: LPS assembly lipoprotein LptE [Bacteroidales bacterium]|nr:LPS assembly lipoprotein LptE [Bacteroidales bacterium]